MNVQVQTVHFDADIKLVELIQRKMDKLDQFHDHIINADVILHLERTGQVQDKVLEIKLHIPGHTLVAKETCKSFEEAIDLASDHARRQLIKHKEKQRIHAGEPAIIQEAAEEA